jgi:hypothetical protein
MGPTARATSLGLLGLLLVGGLWTARRLSQPASETAGPTAAPEPTPARFATADAALQASALPDSATAPSVGGVPSPLAITTTVPAEPPSAPPVDRPATAADGSSAPAGALGMGQGARGGRLGGVYRLRDLRSGQHDGFTRVVWELSADDGERAQEAPLWEVLQQANEQDPQAVGVLAGRYHIRLRLADTYAMDTAGALSLDTPPGGPVSGVRLLPLADDSSLTFAIDLPAPAPYTVSVLKAPLRIVIDVYRP